MLIFNFNKRNIKLPRVLILLSLLIPNMVLAEVHYLQVGQSTTMTLPKKIRTVFITKESVANYEVIGDKKLIIYGKRNGLTNLLVYDEQDNIILNDNIIVDPVLSQVSFRLKQDFPNSNVTIERYAGDNDKQVYVLKGTVPDSVTKRRIIDFIGVMIGSESTETKYTLNSQSGNSSDLDFLNRTVYKNVIDRIVVTEESQVNVKLTFVEVSKKFSDALGIEWSNLTIASQKGSGVESNSFGQFTLLGIKHGFDIGNITTVIRAIKNDELAKVLAEPNLSVLSGETASFLVGGEIPIVKSEGTNGSTSVEYKNYGIQLQIGARVNEDKRIRLVISNEYSNIAGSYQFNNYNIPTLTTRRTSSTIDVSDGDSFVIAGLIDEQDSEKLSRIPFLSEIPILGALARSTSTSRSKTELVIFVTVNLVSPKKSFDSVDLPIFERTDSVNLFFNVKNNMSKQLKNSLPITNESEKFINYMGFVE